MEALSKEKSTGSKRNTIFVVDLLPDGLIPFKELFGQFNHLVYYSTSFDEMKSVMEGLSPDLVIVKLQSAEQSAEEFLGYVKKKVPHALRMAYSQEADRMELMRLVACGVAHRYLCLPWEKNNVSSHLIRDLDTRNKMRTKKCWQFLDSEDRLPILPDVLRGMAQLLRDPDVSIPRLVAVIEKDPIVSSKLLQIVNSAAFPKIGVIGELLRAVTYLGISQVRELVLFICAREMFPPAKRCANAYISVAKHSFNCSILASIVAQTVAPGNEKEAATAALLHDIGKIVFFSSAFCETYLNHLSAPGQFNPFSPESEDDEGVFDISHSELGSCLLLWWDMPLSIIAAAAEHNLPLHNLIGVTKCVAIAKRCIQEAGQNGCLDPELDELKVEFPVDSWRDGVRKILA